MIIDDAKLLRCLERDGAENPAVVLQLNNISYLVEYEKNGCKLCSIVTWKRDEVEYMKGWHEWYRDCEHELIKCFWKADEKFKRIYAECERFNSGKITEKEWGICMEMFADDVLTVEIKKLNGRNRCSKCGKRPEMVYWGNGKIMLQCPECKSKVYVGYIKSGETRLSPAITEALEQWNQDNPARVSKRMEIG